MKTYPEYKAINSPSAITLPVHWRYFKVKYLAKIQTGTTPTSAKEEAFQEEGGLPWLTPDDLDETGAPSRPSKYLTSKGEEEVKPVPAGSTLVCCIGSIGKVGVIDEEASSNQQINAVTFLETSRFGFYSMLSLKEAMECMATGNVLRILNSTRLGSLEIPVPPRDERELISAYLDRETAKIDALIAEQQHLIELLQEKQQAVISHAVTKGLNPSAPMKDSGVEWLGEVPEHWEVLPCRAFLNERDERNGDYRSDYYLSLVAGRGVIPYEEKGDIGNKKPEDLGKCKLVQEGDFVINSMNYGIGSYGVSRFNGVCSPVYIVTTPIREKALDGFSFRVLENKWFQQYAQSFGNGILAHRCAISWDILKNINAGIPPKDEQAKILNYLDELTARYQSLIAQSARQVTVLQERRSALISAAVTGQIDVRGLAQEEEP